MFVPNGKIQTRISMPPDKSFARLTRLFEPFEDLDSMLQAAADMLAENFALQRCVITWLTEDRVTMWVRAKFSRNGFSHNAFEHEVEAGIVEEGYHTHLFEARVTLAGEARNSERKSEELTVPLQMHNQTIGYVCALPVSPAHECSEFDLELFQAYCSLVGHAIEFIQMRQLLASRYVVAAAGKAARGEYGNVQTLDASVLQSVQNPERVARIIARSFYKDLRKAGFAAKQILLIASEIIGHLSEAFHKTKSRPNKSLQL